MSSVTKSKRRRSHRRYRLVHKPKGALQPRVQRVGPEHFGIAAVDCGKDKSRWMLCDFYGKVLREPADLMHARGSFELAIFQLREAMAKHDLKDVIVAIEQTGNYHQPVKRGFAQAGFETRIVHPLATQQLRIPADPGDKTDDNDLAAIFRATTVGFGLLEPPPDPLYAQLRLWTRYRRDLVEKRSAVCCQIREHWEATLPGLAALFGSLWSSPAALAIAQRFASPGAIEKAGREGLVQVLREAAQRFQGSSLDRILAWARTAPIADPQAGIHFQIALGLDEDRFKKTREIQALEQQIADTLRKCNHHFKGLAALWDKQGKDPKRSDVRIASRFSRIAYHIVGSGQIQQHPCLAPREYVLDKLLEFHRVHETSPPAVTNNLNAAAKQLHPNQYPAEAAPLKSHLAKMQAARRHGPRPLGEILILLLAKLGVGEVQSETRGD